jgi:hypothetical protein
LTVIEPNGSVIPVRDRLRRSRTFCGYCAVFKDRRRRTPAVSVTVSRKRERHPAGAGLSKLNSMPATPRRAQEWTRRQAQGRPGSVDVLGPLVARAARDGSLAPAGRR